MEKISKMFIIKKKKNVKRFKWYKQKHKGGYFLWFFSVSMYFNEFKILMRNWTSKKHDVLFWLLL